KPLCLTDSLLRHFQLIQDLCITQCRQRTVAGPILLFCHADHLLLSEIDHKLSGRPRRDLHPSGPFLQLPLQEMRPVISYLLMPVPVLYPRSLWHSSSACRPLPPHPAGYGHTLPWLPAGRVRSSERIPPLLPLISPRTGA